MLVDIGNSRVKIKINKIIKTFNINKKSEIINFIKSKYKDNIIYISSVVPSFTKLLKENLKNYNLYFFSNKGEYSFTYCAKGMGIDRLLADQGALSIEKAPLIVVDMGSALTIEYINKNNYLEGGLIAPGLNMGLKSLNNYASLLPKINIKKYKNNLYQYKNSFLQNETKDAMFYGALLSLSTLVNNFYESIILNSKYKFIKNELKIILTGGDSQFLKKYINYKNKLAKDLVFIGMENLIKKM